MRTNWLVPLLLGLAPGGCFVADDVCDAGLKPSCRKGGAGGAGGSAATSSGPGGGGGGVMAGCDPSAEKTAVDDKCGVFVSSSKGDDGMADGTKAKPYKTIAKALGAKKNIYLCGEKFSEAVALTAGTSIFGALKCSSDWSYDVSTKSAISGPAGSIALKISGTSGSTTVQDVAATAGDGMMPGDSSIAALVDGSTVTFARVALTAGKPQDGAVGDTPMGTGKDGTKGPDGKAGCANTMPVPPDFAVPTNDCGGGENSTGGVGGTGNAASDGGSGSNGGSTPDISNPNGGAGQTTISDCAKGNQGKDGAPGSPGDGATGVGVVSASGYTGAAGGIGKSSGKPGQGGGGGGGARGSVACAIATNAGPSGAGGGSGGCGGTAGSGGKPAGGSIALVSLKAMVTLTASTLTAADGAAGGKGSAGQPGGSGFGGGKTGTGDKNDSCPGGKGGNGGQGGAGGGGLGGHSIGIAYTGMAPAMMTNVTITVGKAGPGGAGGDGGAGNQGGKGDDGVGEKVKAFDAK